MITLPPPSVNLTWPGRSRPRLVRAVLSAAFKSFTVLLIFVAPLSREAVDHFGTVINVVVVDFGANRTSFKITCFLALPGISILWFAYSGTCCSP